MPADITINSKQNTGAKTMFVDYGVVSGLTSGQDINFSNAIVTPTRDVSIAFFAKAATASDKQGTANAIAGFCTQMNTGKTLTVAKASNAGGVVTPGKATCTIAPGYNGPYQYTITAGQPYEDLDPVIIVEGGGARPSFLPLFNLTSLLISLAIIVLAAYLGYRRGRSAGSSN